MISLCTGSDILCSIDYYRLRISHLVSLRNRDCNRIGNLIGQRIGNEPPYLALENGGTVETEQIIQNSIAALVKDRTTFASAHRLSTLRHATKLIVLDGGKIAEFGTHEELMKNDGNYKEMFTLQASSYNGEKGEEENG